MTVIFRVERQAASGGVLDGVLFTIAAPRTFMDNVENDRAEYARLPSPLASNPPPHATTLAGSSAWAVGMGEIVSARNLVGDDHAPSVDDELASLGRVQRRKICVDPVETQV